MKELSIEEKARAYDEALGRMKSWARGEHPECFTDAQKAAEFVFPELKKSEEERIKNELVDFIYDKTDTYELREKSNSWLAWLEKQGNQKPAEWSEEDKKMFVNIKACLRNANKDYSAELDWLKSLKPQKQWKPNKEQINALKWILMNVPYCKHKEEIDGLLEQLKQL